ncbi:MAG: Dps family protein [Terracidiphilus sp.]
MDTATKGLSGQIAHDLGLEPGALEKVGTALAGALADTYLLYVKTQNYHWNVTGPHFGELHMMFEQQYRNLADAVDELAERLRAIGRFAPGSYAQFSQLSKIKEAPERVPPSMDMVRHLADDHEHVVRRMREVLETSDSVGDQESSDIMIARMRYHAKQAWMLRSYLQ